MTDLSTSISNELTQLRNHLDEALGSLETSLREATIASRAAIVAPVAGTEAVGFVNLTARGIFAVVTGMGTLLGVELPLIKSSVSRVAPSIQSFLQDPYLDKIEERMREVVKDLARDINKPQDRWHLLLSMGLSIPYADIPVQGDGRCQLSKTDADTGPLKIKGVDLTREDIDRLRQETPRQLPMA